MASIIKLKMRVFIVMEWLSNYLCTMRTVAHRKYRREEPVQPGKVNGGRPICLWSINPQLHSSTCPLV
jgi:hypothetical protein